MSSLFKTVGSSYGEELRAFNDEGIQRQITRALNDIPAGKKGAVVAYWSGKTVRGAVVSNLGHGWSVVGTLSHNLGTKETELGAAVRWAW